MTELLTAAQMRAIEAAAIASGAVTGLELMERAGRGVVEAIFEEWPELQATSHRAVVLCGPGNNGGDGFVVARLLKEWGWEVEVFLYGDPERMPADARVNYERWVGMGEVRDISAKDFSRDDIDRFWQANLVIDALFGIGLARPAPLLEAHNYVLHRLFNDSLWWVGKQDSAKIVAIDQPSGMCADSGRELRDANGEGPDEPFAAYLTVTFHRPKVGHFLEDGPRFCTKLKVVDIGLAGSEFEDHMTSHPLRNGTYLTRSPKADFEAMQRLRRAEGGHKYTHGHAFILAGLSGRGGAARLSARGALRVGAGVVTVGCPAVALAENAARLDAVMLRVVEDGAALEAVLEDGRIGVVCLGPGLGTGAREAELVAAALGVVREERPLFLVLDADALTILSREAGLFGALHDHCVLTPHGGEFARLFPDIAEKLAAPAVTGPAYSKVDATREAAARAGCVVLFKGADTVIAAPDGRCAINSAHYDRAAPWLATAGAGDVLAGFIAGLMARGFAPFDAACTGAWLHVECAQEFGPGLIAEDLPEMLPAVFRRLGV